MPIQNLHETLIRCKCGDTAAFRCVMEEFQGYAFAVAFRIVCDEEDARDVVQDSFIRVWKNFGRYDTATKFTTWLYSIVTNLCLDKLRSRKRMPLLSDDEEKLYSLASTTDCDDPEKLYSNKELASIIAALTDDLPPKQKIIFVLRDLQDLNVKEVCEILELSESSVKTNLVYARRHIRQQLEQRGILLR